MNSRRFAGACIFGLLTGCVAQPNQDTGAATLGIQQTSDPTLSIYNFNGTQYRYSNRDSSGNIFDAFSVSHAYDLPTETAFIVKGTEPNCGQGRYEIISFRKADRYFSSTLLGKCGESMDFAGPAAGHISIYTVGAAGEAVSFYEDGELTGPATQTEVVLAPPSPPPPVAEPPPTRDTTNNTPPATPSASDDGSAWGAIIAAGVGAYLGYAAEQAFISEAEDTHDCAKIATTRGLVDTLNQHIADSVIDALLSNASGHDDAKTTAEISGDRAAIENVMEVAAPGGVTKEAITLAVQSQFPNEPWAGDFAGNLWDEWQQCRARPQGGS